MRIEVNYTFFCLFCIDSFLTKSYDSSIAASLCSSDCHVYIIHFNGLTPRQLFTRTASAIYQNKPLCPVSFLNCRNGLFMKTRRTSPLIPLIITSIFAISASNLTKIENSHKLLPRVTIPPSPPMTILAPSREPSNQKRETWGNDYFVATIKQSSIMRRINKRAPPLCQNRSTRFFFYKKLWFIRN